MASADRSLNGLRLVAFNTARWHPPKEEWILANRLIQPQEVKRISKFAFQKDGKASMAGRLLLRRLLTDSLSPRNNRWSLSRNSEQRPVLEHKLEGFDFNVSHQGEFSVAVAGNCERVGVDVMQMEYSGGKSVSDFFRAMRKQFTQHEWNYIESISERSQLRRFYRLWSLKESYVKAIGVGLAMNLQRINFKICSELPHNPILISTTTVEVDGVALDDWKFHETLLDDKHCISTAVLGPTNNKIDFCEQIPSFAALVKNLSPQNELTSQEMDRLWTEFENKHEKIS